MTEHDLRNLLLEYETSTAAAQARQNPPAASGRFLARFLTAITIILWLLAVAAITWYLIYTVATIEELAVSKRTPRRDFFDIAVVSAVGVVASLIVASIGTLVTVFVARAARLRRINAGLFEVLSRMLQHKKSETSPE